MLALLTFQQFVERLSEPLVLFGFLGQCVFMLRFVVQWIVSERLGRSTVPIAFWYISCSGGVLLLIYGLLDGDPVILLGQSLGLGIYVRNLVLIHRQRGRVGPKGLGIADGPGVADRGSAGRGKRNP